MAEIRLTLEGEALREATLQAITGVLTPEVQAGMIKSAIEALLSPTQSYQTGRRETPIETAFHMAVDRAVQEQARKMVSESVELQEHIAGLLQLAINKLVEKDPDILASKIADAFISQLYK